VQSTQAKIVMEEGRHPAFSVPVFSFVDCLSHHHVTAGSVLLPDAT